MTFKQLVRAYIPVSLRLWLLRLPAILRWFLQTPRARHPAFDAFVHLASERRSPLRRGAAIYAEAVQRAKERNVATVARLLDGVVIEPGATFSWHRVVGPPLLSRGFVPGPELRGETLSSGVGGGACQASNLLYWLAVHAGLDIVERHRHSLDLFPDDGRDVPFGCGATVLFPARDLRLRNPHASPVMLGFRIEGGTLLGSVLTQELLPHSYRLVERHARVEQRGAHWWRINVLERHASDGSVEILCRNEGRLCYEPAPRLAQEIA